MTIKSKEIKTVKSLRRLEDSKTKRAAKRSSKERENFEILSRK